MPQVGGVEASLALARCNTFLVYAQTATIELLAERRLSVAADGSVLISHWDGSLSCFR
jgi:hypothetical protein